MVDDKRSGIPARLTAVAAKRLTPEERSQVKNELANAAPDRVFNGAEASIYVDRSLRTIKRAIDAGVGPDYQKNPSTNPQPWKTTNQHVKFRKSDLDAWMKRITKLESSWTGSFRDFDDVVRDEPWIVIDSVIHGHLLDAGDIALVLDLLEEELVEFLRIDEALTQRWISVSARKPYQDAFLAILRQAENLTTATDGSVEIGGATGDARGGPRQGDRL